MDIKTLLVKEDFKTINQLLKEEDRIDEAELDKFINLVCNPNSILSGVINSTYGIIKKIAKNIEGLTEAHIIKLGIRFKQKELKRGIDNCSFTYEFLSAIPNFPDALADNYAEYILATDSISIIEDFIDNVNYIPNSTNIILANGIVKMANVYKSISINNISYLLHSAWSEKISKDALSILARPIIDAKDLNEILNFANAIKKSDTHPQVWEKLTDSVITLTSNDFNTIYEFSLNYPNANKDKIARVLIEAKSFKWIYKFARDVKNIPEDVMKTIVTYVASTYSPEFIYLFLSNVNLSVPNTKILTDAIMKTEDTDYIGYSIISLIIKETKENEFKGIKEELTIYLTQKGNLDFLVSANNNHLKELEEKLLNSDDSIENSFAQIEEEKRMNFVRPEENA